MLSFDQRSPLAAGKKCKLQCKLEPQANHISIAAIALLFTQEDLQGYLTLRAAGLTQKSVVWLKKSAELLWNATEGIISVSTLQNLRNYVLEKYRDIDAKRKVLQFARAFLRYMSKISFDRRYAAFDLFLQLPRAVKEQKRVTERIVTKEDFSTFANGRSRCHRTGAISFWCCYA